MQTQGAGFMEAVEQLAAEAGMEVPKPTPAAAEAERHRLDLHGVLEAAASAYQRRLHLPEGRAGRDYLLGRGLTEETIRKFGLGWSGAGRGQAAELARQDIPHDMLRRGVNVGFSGGEKKRNEILQMALFEPSLCILDEMDSGLDIDALRVAADGVNALRSPDRAMVVITHYQRLLNYIVPDIVHVMSRGRVVKSGGKELALELEASGYAQFEDAA